MLKRVISGFQTGADIAGILSARRFGLATGGWMPKGYLTETGPRPDYILYGAIEMATPQYPPRTRMNAKHSDLTIWFGKDDSAGLKCTRNACREAGKQIVMIVKPADMPPERLAELLIGIQIVNVAGNRESISPGICDRVQRHLDTTFTLMGLTRNGN